MDSGIKVCWKSRKNDEDLMEYGLFGFRVFQNFNPNPFPPNKCTSNDKPFIKWRFKINKNFLGQSLPTDSVAFWPLHISLTWLFLPSPYPEVARQRVKQSPGGLLWLFCRLKAHCCGDIWQILRTGDDFNSVVQQHIIPVIQLYDVMVPHGPHDLGIIAAATGVARSVAVRENQLAEG